MELAAAVRIASELSGRIQYCVFPPLLDRLIAFMREPKPELSTLPRFIKLDPAICFMVLRLDRSMGPARSEITPPDLEQVIHRIGRNGADVLVTQALACQAAAPSHLRRAQAAEWLWRHSLATAFLAEALTRQLNFHFVEEAYMAGLLHDIGKLTLLARTPAACIPLLHDPEQAAPLLHAEERVADADHGRLASRMIRRFTNAWSAADAARYHTASASQIAHALPLVQLVWAANRLAEAPQPSAETRRTVADLLGLVPQLLDRLCRSTAEAVQAAARDLGVTASTGTGDALPEAEAPSWHSHMKASTILSCIYRQLLEAADSNAIFDLLRRSLSAFWGIDRLAIFVHDADSDSLIGRYGEWGGLPASTERLSIPLSAADSIPALTYIRAKPVDSFSRAAKESGHTTIIDRQLAGYLGREGLLGLPLPAGFGDGGGCLLLGVDRGDASFGKDALDTIMRMIAAVAGKLERIQRYHDATERQVADHLSSTRTRTRKIVHEINNPLSIIKNYLKVLAARRDADAAGSHELRIIEEEINRVAGLARALAASSQETPEPLDVVDVNAIVLDMLSLVQNSYAHTKAIRLNHDLDDQIPTLTADRNLLKQALLNLIKNAVEAMPDGGMVFIATRLLSDIPQKDGAVHVDGLIRISVCDDGPGIDRQVREDLFRPFVSTKRDHDGLGLSIVKEAVMQLNGSLRCEAAIGRGTCFIIELPVNGYGASCENTPHPAT